MRYDEKLGIIGIGIREFVATARRAIAAIPPRDEDEPELCEASRTALRAAGLSSADKKELSLRFEAGEYRFELTGYAYYEEAHRRLTAIYELDGDPKKPNAEARAEARGEAYVAAFILLEVLGNQEGVSLKTVYVNGARGESCEALETVSYKKLSSFFDKCREAIRVFARPEIERVTRRLPSLKALKFPYPHVRAGQNEFIHAVYRNVACGGTLFAQAPTGTGKTVSVLFPALLALGRGKCDKIFYFTPKSTTAKAAADCIELFAKRGALLRAVCLYSKERLCPSGVVCREGRELCAAARRNKMAEAVLALYDEAAPVVTAEALRATAARYGICPHELALSYAELADVVICDVNYLFNPDVYLRRFFTVGGNYAFLVDEAHNLPDRAREIYSAQIGEEELIAPALDGALGVFSETAAEAKELTKLFYDVLFPYVKDEIRLDDKGNRVAAAHLGNVPSELFGAFEKACATAEKEILLNHGARDEEKSVRLKYLRDYHAKLRAFLNALNAFDDGYELFIFYENDKIKAKLFCIDPHGRIAERLAKGSSAVFFSGTLSPLHYYRSTLGGTRSSACLEVDSPFDTGQLSVTIMDKVSTRFSEREDTLQAVSRIIAATVSAKRGNYMVFTPSFAYAEALASAFRTKYPKIKTLVQRKGMSAAERAAFLDAFANEAKGYLIGFCVMGGIYSEGVDLAGDRLIGAVIVGIGLPSLSYEREAIAAYYQEKYEEGKEFAYVYPGINRVLQAAGRVIRREDDRGAIVLIDDRFADPIYKKLIPKLWSEMSYVGSATELRQRLDEFWKENNKE